MLPSSPNSSRPDSGHALKPHPGSDKPRYNRAETIEELPEIMQWCMRLRE
jgi:hypothetical protein